MKSHKDRLKEIESMKGWTKGGLRFLFPDQNYAENYFSFEALKFLYQLRHDLEYLNHQAEMVNQPQEKIRLEKSKKAKENSLQSFNSLLKFLEYSDIQSEEFQSYLSQSPEPSALTPNLDNAFRDWSWGDDEVTDYLSLVNDVLSDTTDFTETLCLGAGAGRLCYEVMKSQSYNLCVLNDFNPLLLKIAEHTISGNKLELFEKPVLPQRSDEIYLLRELECPKPLKNINYIVADARTRFLKSHSFSFLFTPWLIDTIDWPLDLFFAHLNRFLKPGGIWLNIGPLHFQSKDLKDQVQCQDILDFATKAGFECEVEKNKMASYMKCSESGSYRVERIHAFRFKKIEEAKSVEFNPMSLEPTWMQDPEKQIVLPVDRHRLASGHELNARVLKLVDGKRSLNQIAEIIAKDFNSTPEKVSFHVAQIIKNSVLRVD